MPYNDPNKTVYIEEDTSAFDKELAREKRECETSPSATAAFNVYQPVSQPFIYQGLQPWQASPIRP